MSDLFSLSGKHVLITGASSGMGRHFANTLAQAGAKLTLAARRADELAKTARSAKTLGAKARSVAMDVRDAVSVETALDAAEKEFGPIAVLINNAGVSGYVPAVDVSEDNWDFKVDTDLKGAWLVAQGVGRRMIRNSVRGSIVNMTSVLARRTIADVAPYAAAKAGLEQLTRALALEWAPHGIRVNALAPGFVRTELNDAYFDTEAGLALVQRIPQKRLGAPADLDGALLLLASDAGAFMTGSVVVVDGGVMIASI